MNRLKLRDKLVVSVGLLILLAVLILTSLSYISLHLAYQRTAEAKTDYNSPRSKPVPHRGRVLIQAI